MSCVPLKFVVAASVLIVTLPAWSMDAVMYGINSAHLASCVSFDKDLNPKANTKDTGCEVLVNKPGDSEDLLSIKTTVNIGTIDHPVERPTQIDVTATKHAGSVSKIEEKVTNLSTKDVDTFQYDVNTQKEMVGGRVIQGKTTFALINKTTCASLRPFVNAFGAQRVAECAVIAQQVDAPLKKLIAGLNDANQKLGSGEPNAHVPSLMKMHAVDPTKLKDVMGVLYNCTQALAAEDMGNMSSAASEKGAASPDTPAAPPAKVTH